jgi:adenylate kinase
VAQAEALDRALSERGLALRGVVLFEMTDDLVVSRLTGRRVCRQCGRNYHLRFSPPARPQMCDDCGGELYQRADDEEETVRRRLAVYARDTKPLIDHYRERGLLHAIRADGTVDEVREALWRVTEGWR